MNSKPFHSQLRKSPPTPLLSLPRSHNQSFSPQRLSHVLFLLAEVRNVSTKGIRTFLVYYLFPSFRTCPSNVASSVVFPTSYFELLQIPLGVSFHFFFFNISLGTFWYGLETRKKVRNSGFSTIFSTVLGVTGASSVHVLGPVDVPGYHISVVSLLMWSCETSENLCYCTQLLDDIVGRSGRRSKAILRKDHAERIYRKYKQAYLSHSAGQRPYLDSWIESIDTSVLQSLRNSMPGFSDAKFLMELCTTMLRKFHIRMDPNCRFVCSDFYRLWSLTSHITTELFADVLNESGEMNNYCSSDEKDAVFDFLGSWEDSEDFFEAAGGSPAFETEFLHKMMDTFDTGARNTTPYFRCVIMSLAKSHRVLDSVQYLSSKGILLARISPGYLVFVYQE